MEVKKAIKELYRLNTISKKLEYYNNYFWPPIQVGFYFEPVGFMIDGEKHKLFCLCDQCKNISPISDFEMYRNIRNQETQRIADFFETELDYKEKVDNYFKISQDCGTTSFTLTFVPDKLEELDINVLPYKNIYIIDITPKDNAEIAILKNCLKQRLLTGKFSFFMSQFTFEKRVEKLEKLLKNKIDIESRNDIFRAEYDKIRKSNVNRDSKKTYDKTLFKILVDAEKISLGKQFDSQTRFSKIEITILAEDVIKYEEYLNRLSMGNIKPEANLKVQSDITLNENVYEKNPYSHIFSEDKAFILFEKLLNLYKDSKSQLADFSFIYRMMYKDGYILSSYKPQMFINWIGGKPYNIHIDKIKTLDNCSTDAKKNTYSTSKELIQLK